MTFDDVLAQVLDLLQRQGRVSYRALKIRFNLDDDYLDGLKDEIIYAQRLAVDEDGKVLVWTGGAGTAPAPVKDQGRVPLSYTPMYLAEKILTSRSALEGERKQVTVLFADLKDSTELIRDLDPEAAQQLLDPSLRRMMDAVHRYEGTVNQMLGDGIMALFGAPIAHEDHALRACYAALAMQAAMQPYTEEVRRTRGLELRMRVGLNAGEVVVRTIGNDLHMDYSAVGETTVLAARMEQTATPGTIRLPATTLRLVEGLVRVTALGPVPVKGLPEPVEVFGLTGVSGLRRRLQAAVARGLTRFVGREQELAAIHQARSRAKTGHGQVVATVGEAGVGKSRLVYECIHSPHTPGWLVLESASVSYGKATPYFPVLDLLRRHCHLEETDDAHTIRAKVTGQVLTLDESLQDTLPALLSLLEVLPDDSPFRTLDPLPPTSAEEFLHALLGDDPSLSPLKQLLIARTEGNPFFLEESVRALVETGVLAGKSGAYRLPQAVRTIQVPATVQAVLAARIDRLPPEEKHLLQTAAVIGTEVPFALLQAIGELSEEELRRGLGHLQAAEFLYETRLFPEPEYTFKHALTHEVAYGSLLLERRRVLHARIVEALEALAPDRVGKQVERLAHHALRGEVWGKAVTYGRQAGARDYDRAAFREALASFEQALQALAYLPEDSGTRVLAIELRLAMDRPLSTLGEHSRRLAPLGEAEALARALDDRARLGRALALMAGALRMKGDLDGALAAGQQALALAVALGDSALQAHASHGLGQAYHAIGDFGRAAELLRRNVAAADRAAGTPSTDVQIESQAWLAGTLSKLGNFAEGRRHGEEALRPATLTGRGQTPIVAHNQLGLLYLTQGDLEHAIRVLEPGLALCRASGHRTDLRPIAAALGYAYALQGRLAEGCALLEEGISESIRTGARQRASSVAWLSEVCRLAGRGEEAWQHVRQALDLARQQKARWEEAAALHQLGVVQAHADPPATEQAETHYQQALALAEELGMRPLQAHCHLGLGTLYIKMSRWEEAHAELSTAIELYRAMEMTFWLPRAEATLA